MAPLNPANNKKDNGMKWASFKRFGSPWFYGYGFQGIVVLGIVPILMPLIVSEHTGASTAGLVVASFYVGQLLGHVFLTYRW